MIIFCGNRGNLLECKLRFCLIDPGGGRRFLEVGQLEGDSGSRHVRRDVCGDVQQTNVGVTSEEVVENRKLTTSSFFGCVFQSFIHQTQKQGKTANSPSPSQLCAMVTH